MRRSSGARRQAVLLVLLIAGSIGVQAEAGEAPSPSSPPSAASPASPRRTVRRPILGQSRESSGLPWRFFRKFGWANTYSRSYVRVRSAFRDVVEPSSESTVRILCGGRQAALGAVVRADGYLVTKASELSGPVRCQWADGREMPAEVIRRLPAYDLAILKTDARDLTPVSWTDGAAPPPGSWVATPGLDELPLAIGIVSVAPRRVIGPPAMLGVSLQQADQGPQIASLQSGAAAEKAGLRVDDVITHVNGARVATREALIQTVRRFRPGDQVKLSIRREDRSLEVTATLSAWVGDERAALLERLGGPLSQRRADFPLVLQHDSILLPNACGGPLVDLDGKVIGVNIARADRVSSYAIPASVVKLLLAELPPRPRASRTAAAGQGENGVPSTPAAAPRSGLAEHRPEPLSPSARRNADSPHDAVFQPSAPPP